MNKIFEKIHGLEMIARIHIWQAHNSYVNFLYFSANLYIYPFLYRIYILINIKSTERTYDIKWEGRIFYCHRVMGFIGNFIIQYPFVPDHFWEKDELKAFSFSIKLDILSIFVRNFISTKFLKIREVIAFDTFLLENIMFRTPFHCGIYFIPCV